jgi:hypothetical protein
VCEKACLGEKERKGATTKPCPALCDTYDSLSLFHIMHPFITYLIKFLDRILGALTDAPTRELPVSQMPQAAPTTESPKPKATPKLA